MGSPFLPLLLSGSQPCWPRRAVLRVAHVPGWMCLLLQGHLCWLSDLRAASCPCRHAHHKGICLGTCTASSSQGSRRLSAAEETEAWRGDAASSGPGCWRGPCPAFLPCCPGCLLNVFPGASSQKPLGGALPALWTPGDSRGSGLRLGSVGSVGSVGGVLQALSSSQDAAKQPAGRDPRGGAVGAARPAVSVSWGAGWAPLPGPESQVLMVRSWPWFPRGVCMCVQVPSPCGRLRGRGLPGWPWAPSWAVCNSAVEPGWVWKLLPHNRGQTELSP